MMLKQRILSQCVLIAFLFFSSSVDAAEPASGWRRHVIDKSSRGADGVRIADVNGDRLPDLTTGWEEGGRVRVYLNPGPKRSREVWPAVTVGRVRSPEDAVFVDLDGDGAVDVVSCCEGKEKTVFLHWAPAKKLRYLDESAWQTTAVTASRQARSWMFCLPMQLDGRNGVDLVAGSKGKDAQIGWFEAPDNPRNADGWRWHSIYNVGWIMSLLEADVDGDGDADIITTDRKGRRPGCYWLKNPGRGPEQRQPWIVHPIGGQGREVMFLSSGDLDGDGRPDLVTTVRGGDLLYFRRSAETKPAWQTTPIRMPVGTGTGKGVQIADLNLDGRQDVVFTCEHAGGKSGVMWLAYDPSRGVTDPDWKPHEISGKKEGVKFDRIELLDLDADGDLDLITCEERDNLGVIWYENPTR